MVESCILKIAILHNQELHFITLPTESPVPNTVSISTSCGSPDPSWPLHTGDTGWGVAGEQDLLFPVGRNDQGDCFRGQLVLKW